MGREDLFTFWLDLMEVVDECLDGVNAETRMVLAYL